MCMICKGLESGKLAPEDAREKLEEFVELDLLDEEHQEIVEAHIAEIEEEEYYWASAKISTRKFEDYEDNDEAVNEAEYSDDYIAAEDEPFEEN